MLSTVQSSFCGALLLIGGASALPQVWEPVSRSGRLQVALHDGTRLGCITKDFTWQRDAECAVFTASAENADPEHFDYFRFDLESGATCGMEHNVMTCGPDVNTSWMWLSGGANLQQGAHVIASANDDETWFAYRPPGDCEALEMKIWPYKRLPSQARIFLEWDPVESGSGGTVEDRAPTRALVEPKRPAACESVSTVSAKPTA